MAASKSGLGYALMKSEGAFYMGKIISVALVLSVIAIAVNSLCYAMERKLTRGREAQ
jgi:ABC-type nitrate/sulfonate/bicarbonate transport system permease component